MKIENSVILITGGASGIGEATADYFFIRGGIVYICDLDKNNGNRVVERIKATPVPENFKHFKGRIQFIKCDVSIEEEVKSMVETIYNEEGRIDAVVNNAGTAGQMEIDMDIKTSLENYKKVFKINVLGVVLISKYVAEKMIKNYDKKKDCNGVIVNISSIYGLQGIKGTTSYSMSKTAVIGMTLPLARDLGKYKIRVVSICPGYIPTPFTHFVDEKSYKYLIRSIPLNRPGKPFEISQAIEAAITNDFINGTVIKVDGGIIPNF